MMDFTGYARESWTSVSDMPVRDTFCLVSFLDNRGTRKVSAATYVATKKRFFFAEPGVAEAWMALPAPYEPNFTYGTWKGEPLKWRVLRKTSEMLFVICDVIVESLPLDAEEREEQTPPHPTWYASDAYRWLKEEFASGAFSEEERARIVGLDCLGASQAERYFASDEDRVCGLAKHLEGETDNIGWWLTDNGRLGDGVAYVVYHGEICDSWGKNPRDKCGVRPAMWLTYPGFKVEDVLIPF